MFFAHLFFLDFLLRVDILVAMNSKQKIIAVIGIVIILISGLFPPWKYIDNVAEAYREIPAGYYLIFAPPLPDEEGIYSIEIDMVRLAIQWITTLFIMAALLYITNKKKDDLDNGEENEEFFLEE